MKSIIISAGDPSGISYEIFDKGFSFLKKNAKDYKILFIETQNCISSKYKNKNNQIQIDQVDDFFSKKSSFKSGIYFLSLNILKTKEKIQIGEPSILSGKCAYTSLMIAMGIIRKYGGNLITLPLSKEWVIKAKIPKFTGHTEELADFFKKKTFMMMYGEKLKVIPLTTHIPIQKVSNALKKVSTKELISAIQSNRLLNKPKIAICGLNPHAGENGKIGLEEVSILNPMIKKLKKSGLNVSGPISADSLFIPQYSKKFDLILACYHDQGLIPFKAFEGKNGVNVTLGLDFIRVSPDHGTAFDIAGKNKADPTSFIQCVKVLTQDDIY